MKITTKEFMSRLQGKNKTVHFSVDDTLHLLSDLKKLDGESVFHHPVLSFFKKLHERYSLRVSFYVFEEFDGFNLADVSEQHTKEFQDNSDWMRFGFHAVNENRKYSPEETNIAKADFLRVTEKLSRIVGKESITSILRLHNWGGDKTVLSELSNLGIKGLLCRSNLKQSYYLNLGEILKIFFTGKWYDKNLDLLFIKTNIRMEKSKNIPLLLSHIKLNHLELFTHELAINDEVKTKIQETCDYLGKQGYVWSFPEDHFS